MKKQILNKQGVNLTYIKELRGKNHLSQTQMAQLLGLNSPDKYTRRENGEYSIQTNELLIISEVFNVPMEKFFPSSVRKSNNKQPEEVG